VPYLDASKHSLTQNKRSFVDGIGEDLEGVRTALKGSRFKLSRGPDEGRRKTRSWRYVAAGRRAK